MKARDYAPILVRISISVVFLWFGLNQIMNPDYFLGYLPDFILSTDYALQAIMANGIFETVLGSLLLAGLFTRIAALALSLKLFLIMLNLGYNDIAVRDFGLSLITFSIYLGGADRWTLDYKRKHP